MSAVVQKKINSKPWFKEPWPWILMTGPVVVIIAGIITTWLAIKTSDGLVTDDYYKQGLTVNQRLQRDHQARDMGLHADVMLSERNVRLLLGANEATQFPEKIVLKIMHPTQSGQDQLVQMESEGQGFYSGKLAANISGRWHVSIEDPEGQWRLQGDWLADSVEPLRLNARIEK